jgi:CRP-like cAMP-binding protein
MLPKRVLAKFLSHIKKVEFKRNQFVFREGEDNKHMYIVLSGQF